MRLMCTRARLPPAGGGVCSYGRWARPSGFTLILARSLQAPFSPHVPASAARSPGGDKIALAAQGLQLFCAVIRACWERRLSSAAAPVFAAPDGSGVRAWDAPGASPGAEAISITDSCPFTAMPPPPLLSQWLLGDWEQDEEDREPGEELLLLLFTMGIPAPSFLYPPEGLCAGAPGAAAGGSVQKKPPSGKRGPSHKSRSCHSPLAHRTG